MRDKLEMQDKASIDIIKKMEFMPKKSKRYMKNRIWTVLGIVVLTAGLIYITISQRHLENQNEQKNTQTDAQGSTSASEVTALTATTTENTTDAMVLVPDVTNVKKSKAKEKLEELGLKVVVTQDYHKVVEKGRVIRQNIEPLTEVRRGSKIKIKISKGKKPEPRTEKMTEQETTGWEVVETQGDLQGQTEQQTQPQTSSQVWQQTVGKNTEETTKAQKKKSDIPPVEEWPTY